MAYIMASKGGVFKGEVFARFAVAVSSAALDLVDLNAWPLTVSPDSVAVVLTFICLLTIITKRDLLADSRTAVSHSSFSLTGADYVSYG